MGTMQLRLVFYYHGYSLLEISDVTGEYVRHSPAMVVTKVAKDTKDLDSDSHSSPSQQLLAFSFFLLLGSWSPSYSGSLTGASEMACWQAKPPR